MRTYTYLDSLAYCSTGSRWVYDERIIMYIRTYVSSYMHGSTSCCAVV